MAFSTLGQTCGCSQRPLPDEHSRRFSSRPRGRTRVRRRHRLRSRRLALGLGTQRGLLTVLNHLNPDFIRYCFSG